MKTKMVNIFAAFVAAAAISVPALAQDAKSLDELLQMIESSSISESADSRGREASFKSVDRIGWSRQSAITILRLLNSVSSETSVSVH